MIKENALRMPTKRVNKGKQVAAVAFQMNIKFNGKLFARFHVSFSAFLCCDRQSKKFESEWFLVAVKSFSTRQLFRGLLREN